MQFIVDENNTIRFVRITEPRRLPLLLRRPYKKQARSLADVCRGSHRSEFYGLVEEARATQQVEQWIFPSVVEPGTFRRAIATPLVRPGWVQFVICCTS